MNTLINLDSINVSIANKNVCNNLNLQIKANECWAILGTNGIGKTTLLHTLAGLRTPDVGSIKYKDKPLSSLSSLNLAKTRAILFQNQLDPFPATVNETVLIGRHPYLSGWQWHSKEDSEIVERVLTNVGMEAFNQRAINTLSGGERQRVSIATVLAQTPQIFLLDEPTNHLDLHHQMKMMDLIVQQKNDSTAIVMILHDINLAARYCDHVIMLFGNGVYKAGKCEEYLNTNELSELYSYPITKICESDNCVFVPSAGKLTN